MVLGKHKRERAQNLEAIIKPFFQYLLQPQVSFYTPTVDFSVPALKFDITGDAENTPFVPSHWCSTKVKVFGSDENLYICESLKYKRR